MVINIWALISDTCIRNKYQEKIFEETCFKLLHWKEGGNNSFIFSEKFSLFSRKILSRKYGLGSLRKTPTEDIPPIGPGPTCGQLALFLQRNTGKFWSRNVPWNIRNLPWNVCRIWNSSAIFVVLAKQLSGHFFFQEDSRLFYSVEFTASRS